MSRRRTLGLLYLVTVSLACIAIASAHAAPPPAQDDITALLPASAYGESDTVQTLLNAGADVNARDKEGRTALILAANWWEGDVSPFGEVGAHTAVVNDLLAHGADVNAKDRHGFTALMAAATGGRAPIVQALLRGGADIDARDRHGRTALTWAARYGQSDTCVQILRKAGVPVGVLEAILMDDRATAQAALTGKADLNARGPYGETALIAAAEKGNAEMTKALLAKGADPNAREDDGMTGLMLALGGRTQTWVPSLSRSLTRDPGDPARLDILKALLAQGANVNARDSEGTSVLLRSVGISSTEVVRLLLDRGANPNFKQKDGKTALMEAIEPDIVTVPIGNKADILTQRSQVVRLLLARGADVNAQDKEGESALIKAVKSGQPLDIVKTLLDNRADVNARTQQGDTALMLATGDLETIQSLLTRGANLQARDKYGATALTWAIRDGKTDTANLLRARGLQIGLMDAVYLGDTATVRTLLSQGANPNAKGPYGEIALLVAVRAGNVDMAHALLAKGANPNAREGDGVTALTVAVAGNVSFLSDLEGRHIPDANIQRDRLEMAKALIARGANVNARSKYEDMTALLCASALGETEIVRLLLEHGAGVTGRHSENGKLALRMAKKQNYSDIVTLLQKAGAKE